MALGDYIILQNVNLVVVGQNNTVKVIFNLQLQVSSQHSYISCIHPYLGSSNMLVGTNPIFTYVEGMIV